MHLRFLAIAAALLIAACSKVTQDNFAKIQEGMSEEQVIALLGSPSESNSIGIQSGAQDLRQAGRAAEIKRAPEQPV